MSILIDNETRLLVQGLTGREGTFHAGRNRDYGTNVVAGVTPGKGGTEVDGVPVFDTVAEAVQETKANTSMIFVPARFAADAVLEAHDAGLDVIVAITEGIPAMDMARAVPYIRVGDRDTTLIGPNCPGLISPGKANVGIIPGEICEPGPVGLVSRSGTLTYQIIHELTQRDIGQSTCVGIGGDPEERAAAWAKDNMSKPVVAYIAGFTAPPGKRMGHAGAIISGSKGTAKAKAEALEAAGIEVGRNPTEVAEIAARKGAS